MRPILWHVDPTADPPTFAVLFPSPDGLHGVATVPFRVPVPADSDPKMAAMRELNALPPKALALVREFARPVVV